MYARATVKSFWWIIHKDLRRELRGHRVWPGMLLLGLVLVFVLAIQVDLPLDQKSRVGGGLLWLAIAFSGTLALDRSLACEREAGCWQTIALYPVPPSVLFLAKMSVNVLSLTLLELVLIPLFVAMTDIPLLAWPGAIALIAGLGNIGFAAVGTLASAITAELTNRGGLLAVLVLPLVAPVVLASAEATRILLMEEIDGAWWRWIRLLAVFATVFTVLGAMLFEFVMED